jgi:hypothetical protein
MKLQHAPGGARSRKQADAEHSLGELRAGPRQLALVCRAAVDVL